jgi:hypothetical protein
LYLLLPAHAINGMAPLPLSFRTSFPPPPTPAVNMARDYTTERMQMLPFDFHPSMPPTPASGNFPKLPTLNVAFFSEKRFANKKPSGLANGVGAVFFCEPNFKRNIQELFSVISHSGSRQNTSEHTTVYCDCTETASAYNAKDDDLAVWKKRIETDTRVKDSDVQDNTEKDKGVGHMQ